MEQDKVKSVTRVGTIEKRILLIRDEKVIVDADLAEIYGVSTKRLNEQVKRNSARFPADFVFRLTAKEKAEVVANCDHLSSIKYSRTRPNAFSEHGAIMAASVLNSPQAIDISVFVVRAFVKLREAAVAHKELGRKLSEMEKRLSEHDEQILTMISAIRQLMDPKPPPRRRRIGFHDA